MLCERCACSLPSRSSLASSNIRPVLFSPLPLHLHSVRSNNEWFTLPSMSRTANAKDNIVTSQTKLSLHSGPLRIRICQGSGLIVSDYITRETITSRDGTQNNFIFIRDTLRYYRILILAFCKHPSIRPQSVYLARVSWLSKGGKKV